jgi:hypothetical protein
MIVTLLRGGYSYSSRRGEISSFLPIGLSHSNVCPRGADDPINRLAPACSPTGRSPLIDGSGRGGNVRGAGER